MSQIYEQIYGNSIGSRVELLSHDDYRVKLKLLSNGMEYTIAKHLFDKYYKKVEDVQETNKVP